MQRLLLNEHGSHTANGLTRLGYNVEGNRPDNYIVCDGGSHSAKVGVNRKSGQKKRKSIHKRRSR